MSEHPSMEPRVAAAEDAANPPETDDVDETQRAEDPSAAEPVDDRFR